MGTDLKKELAQGMGVIRSFGNYSLYGMYGIVSHFPLYKCGFPDAYAQTLPDAQNLHLARRDHRCVVQLVANTAVV